MDRFVSFFKQNRNFLNKKIAIAFSGGSDSLALLYLTSKIFDKNLITAIYINHNLRASQELSLEVQLNRNNCKQLGVKYIELVCNPGEIDRISKKRGSGIEDAARLARYDKLLNFCKANSINTIATAHNSDDQVETMIMRNFNGASPLSFSCIKSIRQIENIKIIRPVLTYSKNELKQLLLDEKIAWSEDSTNKETDYLRNKIRAEITGKVESIFPDVHKIVLRNAKLFEGLQNLVNNQVLSVIKENYVYIEEYLKQEDIVRYKIIRELLKDIDNPSYNQIKHIDSLILEKTEKCERFNLFDIFIKDDKVFFTKSIEDKKITFIIDYSCNLKKELDSFVFNISSNEKDDGKVLKIADEDIKYPLIFRSLEKGDSLKTAGGKIMINKLVSSWKISETKRKLVYVLEDRKGIVAVFARHIDGRDRLAKRMKNTLVGKHVRLYSILNKEIDGETI